MRDEIAVISMEASQEALLEDLLAKVVQRWLSIEFTVVQYKEIKDTYIMGPLEDVTSALEDSMVTMSTILSSKYVPWILQTNIWGLVFMSAAFSGLSQP